MCKFHAVRGGLLTEGQEFMLTCGVYTLHLTEVALPPEGQMYRFNF